MDTLEKKSSLEHHKIVKRLFYVLLIVFGLWAIFVRFYKITEIGLEGDDVFWYWRMANEWMHGNFELGMGYRPAIHATYTFAMKLFGINDYSIKIMNSMLNLGAGVLIYFCSFKTSKNYIISFLTSIVYLSLPFTVEESRSELAHIPSTFYYLCSYLFFCIYCEKRKDVEVLSRSAYISLSGLSLGIASHMHPDLSTMGLPFVLFITYRIFLEERGKRNFVENFKREISRDVVLFSGHYFLTFILAVSFFGLPDVYESLTTGFDHQHTALDPRSSMEKIIRHIYGVHAYIVGSLSSFGSLLLGISVFMMIFSRIRGIKHPTIVYLPFILSLSHIATCLFTVQRKYILRLLHPSTPFLIFCALYWFHFMLKRFKVKNSSIILVGLSFMLIFYSGFHFYKEENYNTKIYKLAYSKLYDVVDKNNKILITPSLFHWYREGFKSGIYFDKNAVYLSQFRHGKWKFEKDILNNFKKLISSHKIKFVLVARNDRNVRKKLHYHNDTRVFFQSMYGVSQDEYSLGWEYEQLDSIVQKLNAKKIITHKKFDIYQL